MQVIAVVVPMVFIVGIYIKRRNVYDLHHAILGKLISLLTQANLVIFLGVSVCGFSLFLTRTQYSQAGLLFSVLITAIVTVAIKDAVGRPRPDFFWRCFPDGVPVSSSHSFLRASSSLLVSPSSLP